MKNKLPYYFLNIFKHSYQLHEHGTRNLDHLHFYPTRSNDLVKFVDNIKNGVIKRIPPLYKLWRTEYIIIYAILNVTWLIYTVRVATLELSSRLYFHFGDVVPTTMGQLYQTFICLPCQILLDLFIPWCMLPVEVSEWAFNSLRIKSPFHQHRLTKIMTCIINYTNALMWCVITSLFYMDIVYYPCCNPDAGFTDLS